MTHVLDAAVVLAAREATDIGVVMQEAFGQACAGDAAAALKSAKAAATRALALHQAVGAAVSSKTYASFDASRAALAHVEDARLFAKAAMDVARIAVRRSGRKSAPARADEDAARSAEIAGLLMVGAAALFDIKRGEAVEAALRKAALASERATLVAGALGGGVGSADDGRVARETTVEIARRALWAARAAKGL